MTTDNQDQGVLDSGIRAKCLLKKRKQTAKRDILAKMLLTGKEWDRHDLLVGLMQTFPGTSFVNNARVVADCVPFMLSMGILERVGKDRIRVRPDLLPLLKEGD